MQGLDASQTAKLLALALGAESGASVALQCAGDAIEAGDVQACERWKETTERLQAEAIREKQTMTTYTFSFDLTVSDDLDPSELLELLQEHTEALANEIGADTDQAEQSACVAESNE